MRDLVPFVQFKEREKTHGGVLLWVKLQASAMGVFHVFLNCTNGTKSRKVSQIFDKHVNITCRIVNTKNGIDLRYIKIWNIILELIVFFVKTLLLTITL